jgi:hypothetical protein
MAGDGHSSGLLMAMRCQVYTQVMPTTPTDDLLANSDRTVGVHGFLDHATNALKREALLFDQIGIPQLDLNVVSSLDDLFWLRDIGIVRDVPPLFLGAQHLDAFVAETEEPIVTMPIPDERIGDEIVRRLSEMYKTVRTGGAEAVLARMGSIDLR